LSSLRDEHRRQPTLDKGPTEQRREVKLPGAEQRAEPSPVRDEGKPSVELWEQVWERENLYTALKRVESNGGAPGIDGMTVKDLRTYLKEHWLEIRAALESGAYKPSPVRRVEIPKPEGGMRLLGIPSVMRGSFRHIVTGFDRDGVRTMP
jgi:RNA-directed DNA polymerase